MMDLLIRIDRAQTRQDFRMCVPPEPDNTGIVLRDCKEEIASLRQQLAAAKFREESLINTAKVNREGLQEQLAAALAAIELKDAALNELTDLMCESYGITGFHRNGDVAPWSEVEEGGRFERLTSLNDALAINHDASALKAHDEALIERCIVTVESESLGDVEGDYSVAVKHCANALRELKDKL